jgi:hypothetical protein
MTAKNLAVVFAPNLATPLVNKVPIAPGRARWPGAADPNVRSQHQTFTPTMFVEMKQSIDAAEQLVVLARRIFPLKSSEA